MRRSDWTGPAWTNGCAASRRRATMRRHGSCSGRAQKPSLRLELVDEGDLRRENPQAGFLRRKPRRAVHLGEFGLAPGSRRPFHGKGVAADRVRVAVALDRPGVNPLAALLAQRREGRCGALRLEAGFLAKLAHCGGERILAFGDLTLGN